MSVNVKKFEDLKPYAHSDQRKMEIIAALIIVVVFAVIAIAIAVLHGGAGASFLCGCVSVGYLGGLILIEIPEYKRFERIGYSAVFKKVEGVPLPTEVMLESELNLNMPGILSSFLTTPVSMFSRQNEFRLILPLGGRGKSLLVGKMILPAGCSTDPRLRLERLGKDATDTIVHVTFIDGSSCTTSLAKFWEWMEFLIDKGDSVASVTATQAAIDAMDLSVEVKRLERELATAKEERQAACREASRTTDKIALLHIGVIGAIMTILKGHRIGDTEARVFGTLIGGLSEICTVESPGIPPVIRSALDNYAKMRSPSKAPTLENLKSLIGMLKGQLRNQPRAN